MFGRKAGRAIKRLKIAVLFGGCSPEYSVSLQSAAAVLQNMYSSKYEAVMVGIPCALSCNHGKVLINGSLSLMTSAEVLSPNGQSASALRALGLKDRCANDLKILTSYLINTLLKINEN